MTNLTTEAQMTTEPSMRPRRRPLMLIGSVLWVCCFVGICFCWYQWQQKALLRQAQINAVLSAEDEGRSQKQVTLVLQKDGTLVAQEVTNEELASPWDAAGIDDFSFTDTEGRTVQKADLLGKPFVIGFVFTHCRGPCPNVTLQMRELQDQLKNYDFNLVTLTVDPERDTMETLDGYGREYGANFDRWKFLTGNQAEIYGLIQHSFKMPVEETKGDSRTPGFEIIHSRNIMLVDSTGRVIGKYDALAEDQMGKLRKDLKRIAQHKVTNTESETQGGK